MATLWLVPDRPASLAAAQIADEVPVILQDFDDAQVVDVSVESSPDIPLMSPVPGRVTGLDCRPGESFESGGSNVTVDGATLLNLATRVPLWRDLSVGDVGDDVRALQEELARLGVPVQTDGILGSGSVEGIASLIATNGGQVRLDRSIPVSRILWLPAHSTAITGCEIALGASIEIGGVVGEAAGPPAEIRVQNMPAALLPGDRVLDIDGISAPIDAEGRVTDPSARAALSAAPSVRAAFASDDPAYRVSATLRLSSPVAVGVVPPSALYAIDGAEACVSVVGNGRPVRIEGSQLGQTYVTFDGEAPSSVAVAPEESAAGCR